MGEDVRDNEREHVLEGTDCWCNPDVETYHGDVPSNPPHPPPPPAPTDEDMEGRW